jgi:hypothetical protein
VRHQKSGFGRCSPLVSWRPRLRPSRCWPFLLLLSFQSPPPGFSPTDLVFPSVDHGACALALLLGSVMAVTKVLPVGT